MTDIPEDALRRAVEAANAPHLHGGYRGEIEDDAIQAAIDSLTSERPCPRCGGRGVRPTDEKSYCSDCVNGKIPPALYTADDLMRRPCEHGVPLCENCERCNHGVTPSQYAFVIAEVAAALKRRYPVDGWGYTYQVIKFIERLAQDA